MVSRNSCADNVDGFKLPTFCTIVTIARDPALLRSLAFALEAHGYQVKAFSSWWSARESVEGATCVILDGSLPRSERDACLNILDSGVGVVLLAEDAVSLPQKTRLQVFQTAVRGGLIERSGVGT